MSGNIPKGGGKATPRYMLLLEGTRIIPFDASGVTTVAGEIITDDQAEPFDFSTLTQPMVVDKQPSDAEIIYITIDSPIQDRLDYGGEVSVEPVPGTGGTVYPTGTSAPTVDGLIVGSVLASTYALGTFSVVGTNLQNSVDLSGKTVRGRSRASTSLILDGGNTTYMNAVELTLTGQANGQLFAKECLVGSMTDFSGSIASCIMAGTIIVDPLNTVQVSINDTSSGIAGASRPVLDFNSANCNGSIRDYNGGLIIRNFDQGASLSIDMSSAAVQLEATCTSGVLKAAGTGYLFDAVGDIIPSGTSVINGGLTVINQTLNVETVATETTREILGTESFP